MHAFILGSPYTSLTLLNLQNLRSHCKWEELMHQLFCLHQKMYREIQKEVHLNEPGAAFTVKTGLQVACFFSTNRTRSPYPSTCHSFIKIVHANITHLGGITSYKVTRNEFKPNDWSKKILSLLIRTNPFPLKLTKALCGNVLPRFSSPHLIAFFVTLLRRLKKKEPS